MAATVRKASLADLPELMRLENESFTSDRLSRRSLRRLLQASTALCLVVDGGDNLLGYALWLFRSGSVQARLYSVVVDSRSQGVGLGRRLLEAGETLAQQRGCQRVGLEVKVDNDSAAGLYQKLGFRQEGIRRGYYQDGADARYMVKTLTVRDSESVVGRQAIK